MTVLGMGSSLSQAIDNLSLIDLNKILPDSTPISASLYYQEQQEQLTCSAMTGSTPTPAPPMLSNLNLIKLYEHLKVSLVVAISRTVNL